MATLLELRGVSKTYTRKNKSFQAIKDISFDIQEGECLGIVGESGSGKSTIARVIANLEKANQGEICFQGKIRKDEFLKDIQMVFQSPANSFNPKMKIGDSIIEPMLNFGVSKEEAIKKAMKKLELCGLPQEVFHSYIHQLSGGQIQRSAITRAVCLNPKLLIFDEATNALDEDIENQVINLLIELQKINSMTYIFISHNIELVKRVCTRLIVMKNTKIVEQGYTSDIFSNPKHPYTKLLISANFDN